jgi:predicted GTPase
MVRANGIRNCIVAVNKLDNFNDDEKVKNVFETCVKEVSKIFAKWGIGSAKHYSATTHHEHPHQFRQRVRTLWLVLVRLRIRIPKDVKVVNLLCLYES